MGEISRSPMNPSDLGTHNRHRIVAAVRQHSGLSRAAIARMSGLSKGAVTTIVQHLIQRGLLVEQEGAVDGGTGRQQRNGRDGQTEQAGRNGNDAAGRTGRRGVLLALNPNYATAIGVEITDARADAIAVDVTGQTRGDASRSFPSDAAPCVIIAAVAEAVREVVAGLPGEWRSVRGIGVALPGLVDAAMGLSLWIPGLVNWHEVPVVALLQRELGRPVFMDWRAYTATLAEQWWGQGRAADEFLCVNVGDGVGLGIVHGGQLFRGTSSMAGMLAHLQMPGAEGGPVCVCGNAGCLQTQVSVPALLHRAQRALADGVRSVLSAPAQTGDESLTFDRLIAAARGGDKLACNLFEDAGAALGIAIANLIHLFNPPLIIVGGALARADDLLLEQIQRSARRAALAPMFDAARITFSTLRPGPAILGATALVFEQVLEQDAKTISGPE